MYIYIYIYRLLRSDGKRPDGVTVVPWRCGKLLVCDATCPDSFAPSYSSHATLAAGEVAALAVERKVAKYNGLPVGSATLCQKYYLLCYSLMLLKFTHYAFENYPLFQYYAL